MAATRNAVRVAQSCAAIMYVIDMLKSDYSLEPKKFGITRWIYRQAVYYSDDDYTLIDYAFLHVT